MTCPFCGHREDKVIDSRESKEGDSIRRRRQCVACERRFTTYERCDEIPYMVVKKDNRREKFDRQKVLNGLLRACEKRPVSMAKLAELVDEVESMLLESPTASCPPRSSESISWTACEAWIRLPMCGSPPYIGISRISKNFSAN